MSQLLKQYNFSRLFSSQFSASLLFVFFVLCCSFIIYYDSWLAMAKIWINYETFTHGFFVLPASLWLIWQDKSIHSTINPNKSSPLGLIFVSLNGFLWLLSDLTHSQVIEQYALVGMFIGSVWFYLGNQTAIKLIFPLLFLYFMVPVGEAFYPPLMKFTADFTIYFIRLSGISVYREGTHFTLPTGNWSVVEACSGLRYILASFTLGVIYSYLNYQKTWKRISFIIFSLILPVIANGFRAYMIVMIGHFSGMTLAVGVDHLIYGAIFFGIIVSIMFYIGSFWKDEIEAKAINSDIPVKVNAYSQTQHISFALIICLSYAIWPFSSYLIDSNYQSSLEITDWDKMTQNPDWVKVDNPRWNWKPQYDNPAVERYRYFSHGDFTLGIYEANFGNETDGVELINSRNRIIRGEERKVWGYTERTAHYIDSLQSNVSYEIIKHRITEQTYILVHWYVIGDKVTNNIYLAKLFQLLKRLTLDNSPEFQRIIYFPETKQYHDNILQLISNQAS